MTRWVALLRAVNLGARNRVPMAELRRVLEERGHGAVRTYVASGNVLLDTRSRSRDRVASELEELIAASFGVETTAIVRTPGELADVVARDPFGDPSRSHVCFLAGEPGPGAARRLAAADAGPERVALDGAHAYLHYPDGVGRARLGGAVLERLLGVPGTVRNWRTVEALAELARSPA